MKRNIERSVCEIGRHCKCKFCHLNEHAALRWHMWRMRNIRELKVNAGARAFKLQFSAEIFFCHHVRVAATNCCRSTLHTPSPASLPPSLSTFAAFLLIWRWQSMTAIVPGYSTKWRRLAFPLCAALCYPSIPPPSLSLRLSVDFGPANYRGQS